MCELAAPRDGPPEHWLVCRKLTLCGRCAQPQMDDAETLAPLLPLRVVGYRVLH